MQKLSEIQKAQLDRVLDFDEISNTIKPMRNSKSPSSDGYPVEFKNFFWPKIKVLLCNLYIEIINIGQMHDSERRGIIALLEKIERDTLYLKNWRPLSLLNVDYKIFTKITSNRMQTVLPTLIHPDQTGFINGRYIGENALDLVSIMKHTKNYNTDALIVSFDFEKAFDTVE